jgi:hypothetical protein
MKQPFAAGKKAGRIFLCSKIIVSSGRRLNRMPEVKDKSGNTQPEVLVFLK